MRLRLSVSFAWSTSFNPRTHVGCDHILLLTTLLQLCFNPRTHVGCDNFLAAHRLDPMFQSTHPRRVRLMPLFLLAKTSLFQSTHPRRVRPRHWCRFRKTWSCFNPRTHVGCDDGERGPEKLLPSFNPRTHVGCDCIIMFITVSL